MKFILERQISNFEAKPKREKRAIRRAAGKSIPRKYYFILGGLCGLFAGPTTRVAERFFEYDARWIDWMIVGLVGALVGLLFKLMFLNPKIKQIMEEKQTEPVK